MAKIKGITIEIGGNTQPLNKALSDVNKKSKDLQSELKQVERLLKLDPGNTELVAQKQKLLADAVENSSEKLKTLRKAQEQVQEQFARGEIGEEQYRAFQREVVKAEQELSKFENQLKDTQKSADSLGDKLNAAGDKMKSAGEKMSIGITAPIVAGGALMLKGAMDAEAAQGKLQASLGLTAKEAEKLGDVAQEVWKDGFGESIEEVSTAIANVRKNMGEMADQELKGVAAGAMTIADVFDQDVNEVTRAAGVMMKNFGISGKDALDLITVGFQKGGDFSGELLDTLREYSPQFVSLGLSADQAMGMLISGAQAGAWNLDKVGDAMKEFNIRAQDGSKTTAEGFAAIGLDAQKMGQDIAAGGDQAQQAFLATITALASIEDPVEQNIAGVNLFGTQWEDLRAKVVMAMADGAKGIDDFQGATEEAAKAARENNPGLAITTAMRDMQASVGPALLPIADIITNTVVPAIKSMAEWFANLSPTGQKFTLSMVGIAAAIGPVLMAVGKAIKIFGELDLSFIKTAAESVANVAKIVASWVTMGVQAGIQAAKVVAGWALMGAQSLLHAAKMAAAWVIAMGPIAWVTAAVVALVALIVANWETVSAKTKEVWEAITNGLSAAWESIKTFTSNSWNSIKQTATNVWNAIKETILSPIRSAKDTIMNIITTIKNAFANMKITIPKPKLPHISVTTKYKSVGEIRIPYPDFDINWYKAGGIFARPSVIGVGEAGTEAVIPLDKMPGLIADALRDAMGGGQVAMAGGITVQNMYVRNDQDIKLVARELYNLQQTNARGRGLR